MKEHIRVAVAAGLAIQGWKSAEELAWMAEQASNAKIVIDVGCWRGRTTKTMASVCPGIIIAIERIDGPYSDDTGRNEILKSVSQTSIFSDFFENLKNEVKEYRVIPIFINAPEVYRHVKAMLGETRVDFVWVDGDHAYPDVSQDIRIYGGLVQDGGILAGHDYEPSFPGVMKAVDELCPGFQRGPGTSWWIRKTAALGNLLAGR